MGQYKTRAELKNLAKEKLRGKYGSSMLACILPGIISYSIILPISFMVGMLVSAISLMATGAPASDFILQAYSYPLGIIGAIGITMFSSGTARFFLNLACRKQPKVSDIFYGYTHQFKKTFLLSALLTLVPTVLQLPLDISDMIGLTAIAESMSPMALGILRIVLVLLSLIGLIVYFPISFMLSQVFYLSQYYPEYNTKQTLQLSMQMMKGHKWRLFCLSVSFVPLLLLGVLTACIGFLWIVPYMQATETEFFLDLINPQPEQQETNFYESTAPSNI